MRIAADPRDGLVLVTGGAGFVGRRLVRELTDQGCEVIVVDNLCVPPIEPVASELRRMSVTDLTAGDLESVSCIYHLAAWKSVPESFSRPDRATENIVAGQHILNLALDSGVRRVIIASSCEVYGEAVTPTIETAPLAPRSAYAAAKASIDCAVSVYRQHAAQEIVIARLFNSYGPGERPDAVVPAFCRGAIANGEIVIEGSGRQRRDFSHVSETVCQLAELSTVATPPDIVNIGSGRSYSVLDLAALVQDRAPGVRLTFAPPRQREISEFLADTQLARQTFTSWATSDMSDGFAQTFEWWEHRVRNG